jgi:hypothetical protein
LLTMLKGPAWPAADVLEQGTGAAVFWSKGTTLTQHPFPRRFGANGLSLWPPHGGRAPPFGANPSWRDT